MKMNKDFFVGNWATSNEPANESSGLLIIKETGETLQCSWTIMSNGVQQKYSGIGMIVENELLVCRFSSQSEGGGIGLYRPIGDSRSNSALWASSKRPDLLGSGIAIREAASSEFEGSYRVRYFSPGAESPVYTVIISKHDSSNLYSLSWLLQDKPQLHGVGKDYHNQLIFAWGGLGIDYELVIYRLDNQQDQRLIGKSARKYGVSEEIFIKKC